MFSFCFLILIPFQGDQYNAATILSILILIWTNDSFAFLVGKNFGKRKLFVSISPKKTVEGFIGGLVFSIATGYLISFYVTNYSLIDWIVIAVIVSIIGTIGDLIESKLAFVSVTSSKTFQILPASINKAPFKFPNNL